MKKTLVLTTALALATPSFADPDDLRYRVIVADAEVPLIHVIDVEADAAPTTLDVTSAARLHLGPDGRHAWAVQRDAGLV
jgi:hypothetical protein